MEISARKLLVFIGRIEHAMRNRPFSDVQKEIAHLRKAVESTLTKPSRGKQSYTTCGETGYKLDYLDFPTIPCKGCVDCTPKCGGEGYIVAYPHNEGSECCPGCEDCNE